MIPFNDKFFTDITKKIINYINELFQKKNYYSLKDIVEHIQYHKDINIYIIYNSIKDIIDHKETIYDINKNKGYIISRGDYYIFQPLFNNDESIPMFYRSTVVNNKNNIIINNIKIEHPKDFELEEKIHEKNIDDIITNLNKDYNDIIEDKKELLNEYDLINSKYKRNICRIFIRSITIYR